MIPISHPLWDAVFAVIIGAYLLIASPYQAKRTAVWLRRLNLVDDHDPRLEDQIATLTEVIGAVILLMGIAALIGWN